MRTRLRSAAVALLAVSMTTGQLLAQSAQDKAAAESLFRDGRRLMDEGHVAEGCRKLEESHRLDAAGGTLLNLAVCHEAEGLTATAWVEFQAALSAAKHDRRADRQTLAKERIAALEPQLPKLVIDVPPASRLSGLKVLRSGTAMNEGAWGSRLAVDPVPLTIEVTAPGYKTWRTTVTVKAATEQRITVPVLEAEARVVEAPPPVASAAPSASTVSPPPPPASTTTPEARWTTGRTAGLVLAGAGIVSIAVGAYFGVDALKKRSDSDAECPADQCTAEGVRLNDQARRSARVADFGVGLGLVSVAAGAVLFFTGSSSASPAAGRGGGPAPRPIGVSFAPTPTGAHAAIGGVW